MINESMFVIAVPDLGVSGAFYRDVLGFEVHEIGDDGWRFFVRDGIHIMAGECPDALPAREIGDHSYFAYLIVDNAEEYFADVTKHDVEIVKPLRDEPWRMREFGLRTIDGHRIMIGQRL
jgi:catechol 2,3-dioxygenase-like lactoylglutathione lyase family enzyme